MISKCYYSCGQSTRLYTNTLKAKLDKDAVQQQENIIIMASYPLFNKGALMDALLEGPKELERKLDEKVFSLDSIAASAKLLQHPKFLDFLTIMESHLPNGGTLKPQFGVDPDTLEKLFGPKTDELIKVLEAKGFKKHVANINAFREAMHNIPEEATESQEKMIRWQLGIKDKLGNSCFTRKFTDENGLHFDRVLGNFGDSEITVKDLESFGMIEVQAFMQWFARSMNCWKLKNGAVSDVFNALKLLLFNTEYKNSPVEKKVDFLLKNGFSIPKGAPVILKLFIDGEKDDIFALAFICILQEEKVDLVVQLPVIQEENINKVTMELGLTRDQIVQSLHNVKTFYQNLFNAGFVKSVQFIEDPESKNLKKVISPFI